MDQQRKTVQPFRWGFKPAERAVNAQGEKLVFEFDRQSPQFCVCMAILKPIATAILMKMASYFAFITQVQATMVISNALSFKQKVMA